MASLFFNRFASDFLNKHKINTIIITEIVRMIMCLPLDMQLLDRQESFTRAGIADGEAIMVGVFLVNT